MDQVLQNCLTINPQTIIITQNQHILSHEEHQRLTQKPQTKHQRRKIFQKYEQCPVCFANFLKSQFKTFGSCGHQFCDRCLKQQVQASIKILRVAKCLHEGCSEKLSRQSPYIKDLDLNHQRRYEKAVLFAKLAENPQLRLCSQSQCDGFINIQQQIIKCSKCSSSFCRQCFMPLHEGNCEQNEFLIIETKYKYTRCNNCGRLVDKIQGCNHMTCLCQYQFCYLCGGDWKDHRRCLRKQQQQQLRIQRIRRMRKQKRLSRVNSERMGQQRPIQVESIASLNQQVKIQKTIDVIITNQVQNLQNNLENMNSHIEDKQEEKLAPSLCKKFWTYILVFFLIIISFELIWSIILLTIVPVFMSVFLFLISIIKGFRRLINNYQFKHIIIGNIILLIFCIGQQYSDNIKIFFCEDIWRIIWRKQSFFPITYDIWYKFDIFLHK